MCTTTHDKSNTGPSGAEKKEPPSLPDPNDKVLPFAAMPYPQIAKPDAKFQTALQNAYDAQKAAGKFGLNSHVAISMIALAQDGKHRYAGIFDQEKHFSASLVKVAAMYTAHELLAAARRLARRKNFADKAAFLSALSTEFDPQIAAKAPARVKALVIKPDTTPPMGHAPRYADLFNVHNASLGQEPAVDFLPQFQSDLESMIKHGTNEGASRVIRKLSYDYINAALLAGGFFFPATTGTPEWGIWLAGDYIGDRNKPKFANKFHVPYVRIDTVNDCFTKGGVTDCADAQISATKLMANLFALIKLGLIPAGDPAQIVDPDPDVNHDAPETCFNMKDLLSEPKPPPENDFPFMDPTRMQHAVPQFRVTHDKVGVANLKPDAPTPPATTPPQGPDVHSEGLIIDWIPQGNDAANLAKRKLSGRLAVSWQNLVDRHQQGLFDGVCDTINDAFSDYLLTPP